MSDFRNVYEDENRARSYAGLGFPGTYYLAFRDLPSIIERHGVRGRALDFGCGTGRSTRFLREQGCEVTGVDISEAMLSRARELDPGGDYRLVGRGELAGLEPCSFDLVFSAFTFDNIPTNRAKLRALSSLRGLLKPSGRIVSIVSSPEMYVNEWASFSTRDFPENALAGNGDVVLIVMLDVEDGRPVEDVMFDAESYHRLFDVAGLSVLETLEPLADGSESIEWKSETKIAPWVLYVLGGRAEQEEVEK